MSATSPPGRADTLRGRPDCWSAVGWLLAVTALCGTADFLALPDGAVWLGMPLAGHEMFRPEWLVMGTLVAFPLVRLARASVLLGLLGLFLSAGEMVTIVDNAKERFVHNAALFAGAPHFFSGYYLLAGLQAVIFVVAVGSGLRGRFADLSWNRMMRKMSKAEAATTQLSRQPPRARVTD